MRIYDDDRNVTRPNTAGPSVNEQLKNLQDLFIRRWGEMGQTWASTARWPRFMALCYITAQPSARMT